MFEYAIPLIALLTVFMATLTSLRFIITRQGAYWIIPCIISLMLTALNLNELIAIAETGVFPDYRSFSALAPVLISILWYLMIITFHYALRYKVESARWRNESRKNRAEAEYIRKAEERESRRERKAQLKKTKREEKRRREEAMRKPRLYREEGEAWSDLFSE